MKSIITSCVALSLTALGHTQENTKWAMAIHYDFKGRSSSAIALRRIGEIRNVLGRGINLEVDGFVGVGLTNPTGLAGVAIGRSFRLADNVDFKVSLAATGQIGQGFRGGLILGATWKM